MNLSYHESRARSESVICNTKLKFWFFKSRRNNSSSIRWQICYFSEAIKSVNNVGELWKHLKDINSVSISRSVIMFDYFFHVWKVNTNKSKVMVFSKGRLPIDLNFKMNNMELEIVSEFIHLGTMFQRTGSFTDCNSSADSAKSTVSSA
jgi:hypothetical protein